MIRLYKQTFKGRNYKKTPKQRRDAGAKKNTDELDKCRQRKGHKDDAVQRNGPLHVCTFVSVPNPSYLAPVFYFVFAILLHLRHRKPKRLSIVGGRKQCGCWCVTLMPTGQQRKRVLSSAVL